jgi:hypothetical protein
VDRFSKRRVLLITQADNPARQAFVAEVVGRDLIRNASP